MLKKRGKTSRGRSKEENFLNELLVFYKDSMGGLVNSVKQLAKIEENFPNQYKLFKNLSKNPDLFLKLSEKLDPEEKSILFELFIKSSSLSQRTNILHELTSREKMILAKDLKKFSDEVVKKLKKLRGR